MNAPLTPADLAAIRADAAAVAFVSDGSPGPERVRRSLEAIPRLVAEVETLRDAVQRVRALHCCDTWTGQPTCRECTYDEYAPWPCDTIRALDGEEER